MSPRSSMPYWPRLCSHGISQADMERQATDAQRQSPYLPDTCLCYYTAICCRHIGLTSSHCKDSGCLSSEVSETAALNPVVQLSPKQWSITTEWSHFTVPSFILPMNFFLAIWLGLTMTHWQIRLFSCMSTHPSADLLTIHHIDHLVVHGTSGMTKTIPTIQYEISGGVLLAMDTVQWLDDSHWLCNHDDNDDDVLKGPPKIYTSKA